MRQLRNVGLVLAVSSIACLMSCKPKEQAAAAKPDFASLTDDFVYGSLALSPASATSAGYHQHKGVNLDEEIDDYSPAGIDQQHKFYTDFHNRLAALPQDSLSAEDKADYQIIDNIINLQLLEFEKIQSYQAQSDGVCGAGGQRAVQSLHAGVRAQRDALRADHPASGEDAGAVRAGKANLVDAPEIWNSVAREENDGNLDLIDKTLRAKVPEAPEGGLRPAPPDRPWPRCAGSRNF